MRSGFSPRGLVFAVLAASGAGWLAPGLSEAGYGELRELYRGGRAQAFGNAYTAVADDEQTLFLNPAGLAGIKKTAFKYAVADIETSGDVITSPALLTGLDSSSPESLNSIMGKDIYTRVQITPTIVMPNFGVGLIIDQQVAILAKNTALPAVTAGYQTTNGVQFGAGFSLGRKSRAETFTDLRFGLGGKILWRRGGYRDLSLTQLANMNSQEALLSTVGEFGMGYGIDAGMQLIRNFNSRLSLSFGAAMTEIGNVAFSSTADTQMGNLSTGMALTYRLPSATVGLAYDYRHILNDTDWKLRTHLGTFVELPFLSMYMGLNQLHLTYGASFDAWVFRVTAVTYAEEIGFVYGQESERRYLLRLSLNFGL